MTMPLDQCRPLPVVAVLPNAEEAAARVQLVNRYNCLVGKPGKITKTIQKQFLMGFMSQDDAESLRGLYRCVSAAMESAIRLQGVDSEQSLSPMNKGDARWFARTVLRPQDRR